MTRAMPEPVQVSLESECPVREQAAVARVFEGAGINADVQASTIRRSAAAAFGAGPGSDAWQGLKRLVQSIYKAREDSNARQGGITLRDSDTNVEIPLPPDLADEAYRRLYALAEPKAPLSGILVWNAGKQEWIDVFEGKLRCDYPDCTKPATQVRLSQPSPGTMSRRTFCDRHAAASDTGDLQAWSGLS